MMLIWNRQALCFYEITVSIRVLIFNLFEFRVGFGSTQKPGFVCLLVAWLASLFRLWKIYGICLNKRANGGWRREIYGIWLNKRANGGWRRQIYKIWLNKRMNGAANLRVRSGQKVPSQFPVRLELDPWPNFGNPN